jgi:hypothetical protein
VLVAGQGAKERKIDTKNGKFSAKYFNYEDISAGNLAKIKELGYKVRKKENTYHISWK